MSVNNLARLDELHFLQLSRAGPEVITVEEYPEVGMRSRPVKSKGGWFLAHVACVIASYPQMILPQPLLLPRLRELLDQASSVDIAVAWSRPGAALNEILKFAQA